MTITELVTLLKGMNIIDAVNFLIGMIPYVEKIPYAAILIPAVLAIVSIIFAHAGKKLLNLLKLVICAGAGFYLGYKLLWGYVATYLEPHGISNIMVGAALAIIGAILSKFAYTLVFAGAFGYAAYLFLPLEGTLTLIAGAVVVAVVALIFRGILETVVTAVGGGVGFSVGIYSAAVAVTGVLGLGANGTGIKLEDTIPVLGPLTFETVAILFIAAVVAILGFFKQIKNRHRY